MPIYECKVCFKKFDRKSNYEDHIYKKKKPCKLNNIDVNDDNLEFGIALNHEHDSELDIDLDLDNFDDNNNNNNNNDPLTCIYCNKKYSRLDNLKRHIENYCKIKKEEDEKNIKINLLIEEVTLLKELILQNGLTNVNTNNNGNKTINNSNNTTNNNINNNIQNNIQNNNTNVQVNINGFGKEIMENLDISEAMKVFLKSTGGNIIPNMLKHINMNKKYPQNHNICITDFAREIVRINDGKKCIFKKFKNAKYDIVSSVSNNINSIVDIYKEGNYKRSNDIDNKIEINTLSVRLINGEELTDDESEHDNEHEKKPHNNNSKDVDNNKNDVINFKVESKEEIENSIVEMIEKRKKNKNSTLNVKQRLNIEHLNSKREGLQKLTFEKLKEELYNGKNF